VENGYCNGYANLLRAIVQALPHTELAFPGRRDSLIDGGPFLQVYPIRAEGAWKSPAREFPL
jgi:hypothetical protein